MSTQHDHTSSPLEACAHCGAACVHPVAGAVRTTIVVYCSAACRDDHVAALALAGATCRAPGCDLDVAADVPYCDQHLDPAAPAGPRGHGSRAA